MSGSPDFSKIERVLLNDIIMNITEETESLRELCGEKYNLIITGSVGVGKSTISQCIYEIMRTRIKNVNKFPEYISTPTGQNMFEMMVEGKISSLTFQNYILDTWKFNLSFANFGNNTAFNIFERLPHDSLFCFAKDCVSSGTLTSDEFSVLVARYNQILRLYEVPEYDNCPISVVENSQSISISLDKIIRIVKDDIKKGINTRVIGLVLPENEYSRRIKSRGRKCEDKMDLRALSSYNLYYHKLIAPE